jgi:hypothetical protein
VTDRADGHYTRPVNIEESEEFRRLRAENEELGLRVAELSAALERVTERRDALDDSCQSMIAEISSLRAQLSNATARLARISQAVATEGVY